MPQDSFNYPKPSHRLLLLTQHYWPCGFDATFRLRSMIRMLREEGWQVQVLTPRWHPSWPSRVSVEECIVWRLEHPPSTALKSTAYRRSVADWLTQHEEQWDCVWCDSPSPEVVDVCRHRRLTSTPIVVRFDPGELSSDGSISEWRPSNNMIEACLAAAIVVVPDSWAQQILLSCGVDRSKIKVCSDWQVRSLARTTPAIRAARTALAEISFDLSLRHHERLMVIPGRFKQAGLLLPTIRALIPFLEEHSHVRLWIVGDCPEREKLYDLLQYHGLHHAVVMPGCFSCLDGVLQSTDLCWLPETTVGLSWILPTCLISGIPTLVAWSDQLQWHIGAAAQTISYSPESTDGLLSRLQQWHYKPAELNSAVHSIGQLMRRQMLGRGWSKLLLGSQLQSISNKNSSSSRAPN